MSSNRSDPRSSYTKSIEMNFCLAFIPRTRSSPDWIQIAGRICCGSQNSSVVDHEPLPQRLRRGVTPDPLAGAGQGGEGRTIRMEKCRSSGSSGLGMWLSLRRPPFTPRIVGVVRIVQIRLDFLLGRRRVRPTERVIWAPDTGHYQILQLTPSKIFTRRRAPPANLRSTLPSRMPSSPRPKRQHAGKTIERSNPPAETEWRPSRKPFSRKPFSCSPCWCIKPCTRDAAP